MLKDALRQHLARACPEQDLKRWFDPLEVEVIEPIQVFSVQFPHPYFAQWFGQSVQDLFETEVGRFMGPGYVLQYHCRTAPPAETRAMPFTDFVSHIDFPFGHGFTFETYCANEKNTLSRWPWPEVAKGGESNTIRSSSAGPRARERPICCGPWPSTCAATTTSTRCSWAT